MIIRDQRQKAEILGVLPKPQGRGTALGGEEGASSRILELGRSSIGPPDGAHHRSECRNRTNHRQHQKTHHQKERRPHILEDDMVHCIALLFDQRLPGVPPAAAKPRSHWITLGQPPSTTWAVSCPNQPRAVVHGSPAPSVRGAYKVLPVEYHVQGHPSSAYNEVGRKSMQLLVGTVSAGC